MKIFRKKSIPHNEKDLSIDIVETSYHKIKYIIRDHKNRLTNLNLNTMWTEDTHSEILIPQIFILLKTSGNIEN